MKTPGVTKVTKYSSLTKFKVNPLNSCPDVSLWTVVLTKQSFPESSACKNKAANTLRTLIYIDHQ